MNTKVPNYLWAAGIIAAFLGGIINSRPLYSFGLVFSGAVLLCFQRQLSGAFIEMYPTTSPKFIRYSTALIGVALILLGVAFFFGLSFGAR